MKKILIKHFDESEIRKIEDVYRRLYSFYQKLMYPYGRFIKTPINLIRNAHKMHRKLEIGPGSGRLPGFETLNVVWDYHVDYVLDASKKLPFASNSFNLIYASHVLEHLPWYTSQKVLKEWVRILDTGGRIEIWVPDGLKICETLTDYEKQGVNNINKDGWYRFNPKKEPCLWASGRIFTYGDGSGRLNHWNWHRALFTPNYLIKMMKETGLINIRRLGLNDARGADHGWINLGMAGTKK